MKYNTVILDWAGTAVDFGCFAPVAAFQKAFEKINLFPTMEETRAPMGMKKWDHIETMLKGQRLAQEFVRLFGRAPEEKDIAEIYDTFEQALFAVLHNHAQPLPDVCSTVAALREKGVKIGSTTGYTKKMMDVVTPKAKEYGYAPDCLVCPDDVDGAGRPYPYMLWKNVQILKTERISQVIKIGDTVSDMEEGKNAGCFTLGVLKGSSILGWSQQEWNNAGQRQREEAFGKAREVFYAAGADEVIEDITQLTKFFV